MAFTFKLGKILKRWSGGSPDLSIGLQEMTDRINDLYDGLNPNAPGNQPQQSTTLLGLNANGIPAVFTIQGTTKALGDQAPINPADL